SHWSTSKTPSYTKSVSWQHHPLRLNKGLAHVTARAQSTEPFWDERVIRPIVSATQRLAKEIQHLQSGDFRLYCLYVVAALVVLLIAIAV
ncbi:hypothetical protein SM997_06055, partial [Escherichia coli]|nr:hypothetical protein [Escherichia coli]